MLAYVFNPTRELFQSFRVLHPSLKPCRVAPCREEADAGCSGVRSKQSEVDSLLLEALTLASFVTKVPESFCQQPSACYLPITNPTRAKQMKNYPAWVVALLLLALGFETRSLRSDTLWNAWNF